MELKKAKDIDSILLSISQYTHAGFNYCLPDEYYEKSIVEMLRNEGLINIVPEKYSYCEITDWGKEFLGNGGFVGRIKKEKKRKKIETIKLRLWQLILILIGYLLQLIIPIKC